MNGKLLCLLVVSGSCFHHWRIVPKSEFSEAEAAHAFQTVYFLHKRKMTSGVEAHKCTSKKVELHCKLSRKVAVNAGKHLVRSEDVFGVVLEIKNGN